MIDGVLNINKPSGLTSFSIVKRVKRLARIKKVGHGGTLDPLAEGVLPVFLGQATRFIEFLSYYPKTYRAEIRFGISTETYDAEGRITAIEDPSGLDIEKVQTALLKFKGDIYQSPPAFSAIKHQGKRLYELARKGHKKDGTPRKVVIYQSKLIDWDPFVATIDIECGAGTYIRSLANDLGKAVECPAYLKSLVRFAVGPMQIEDALTLDELESKKDDSWQYYLHPIDVFVRHLPKAKIEYDAALRLRSGQAIHLGSKHDTKEILRIYTDNGILVALATYDNGGKMWHPYKVFAPSN